MNSAVFLLLRLASIVAVGALAIVVENAPAAAQTPAMYRNKTFAFYETHHECAWPKTSSKSAGCTVRDYWAQTAAAVYFANNENVYFYTDKEEGIVLRYGAAEGSGDFVSSGTAIRGTLLVQSWSPLSLSYRASFQSGTFITYSFSISTDGRTCQLVSAHSQAFVVATAPNNLVFDQWRPMVCKVFDGAKGFVTVKELAN